MITQDCIVINIVGKVDRRKNRAGIGLGCPNVEGKLLYTWAEGFDYVADNPILEAEAVRLAFLKAKAAGWTRVKLLRTNQAIVKKVNDNLVEDVQLATLLEDISNLKDLFSWCSLSCVSKNCNTLANNLACFAVDLIARENRCLNSELLHACVGPLVSLLATGSRVVYFLEGHSEQVYTDLV
ncbi:hypothetical protein ACH5RR_006473 [Cinchona calisaya]|uniref:RNase H type-1 domain-containing protein n=1 Tax=Cinchona calisaya TaxID=153742 RepID=A0ABD3AP38_9GENT